MSTPSTLHGYEVIAHVEHATCSTVMVDLKDNEATPFVVATWTTDCKDGWMWGHYCASRAGADDAFAEVSARNGRRS